MIHASPSPSPRRLALPSGLRPVLAAVCGALALAACSPSTKGETQRWGHNVSAVSALGTRWPGFAPLLQAGKAAAQKEWDAAEALSDEEAKAAKMKAANEAFGPLLARLREVDSKQQGVEELIGKLNKLKVPNTATAKRGKAVQAARASLAEIQAALSDAKPSTAEEGDAIAKAQVSKLISTRGALQRTYDDLSGKKKKKK